MRQDVREHARFAATCVAYVGAFCCLLTLGKAPTGLKGVAARLRLGLAGKRHRLRERFHDTGHCYVARVPAALISDAHGQSRVVVYEGNVPLAKPHAAHDEIRTRGLGAYSHWNDKIYFSTTDNSDPRSNGRRYTYAEV